MSHGITVVPKVPKGDDLSPFRVILVVCICSPIPTLLPLLRDPTLAEKSRAFSRKPLQMTCQMLQLMIMWWEHPDSQMTVYSKSYSKPAILMVVYSMPPCVQMKSTSVLAPNSVVVMCPSFMEMETTSMSGVDGKRRLIFLLVFNYTIFPGG